MKATKIALLGMLLLVASLSGNPALPADQILAQQRTRAHILQSKALGEQREIFVRTPEGYEAGDASYPVVYVLDGEWNFDLVASNIDYLSRWGNYPKMIVTGIRNVIRNRDYVPREDPSFPYTGGADTFYDFVDQEWIAFIEENYRAGDDRILIGHSFGGTFTLHAFFGKPQRFDAYIALGASTWVSDRVIFEEAEEFFAKKEETDALLFMAVGEGDGGPTVPDGDALAALFEAKALPSLKWEYRHTPQTDHFSNMVTGMQEGFQWVFPRWGLNTELAARARDGGPKAVNAWFAEKTESLGFRFQPSWFDIGVEAFSLARDGFENEAVTTMTRLLEYYPDNPDVASFSASVFQIIGRFDEEEREVARALGLAKKVSGDPDLALISSLENRLKSLREQHGLPAPETNQ